MATKPSRSFATPAAPPSRRAPTRGWNLLNEVSADAQGTYLVPQELREEKLQAHAWGTKKVNGSVGDHDVEKVQTLYVDIDAKKAERGMASEAEVWEAFDVAADLYVDIASQLGGEQGLGFLFSGSGFQIWLFHDATAPDDMRVARTKLLHSLSTLYSRGYSGRVDTSVRDLRRIGPAAGSWKRKPSSEGRPHRLVGFWVAAPGRLSVQSLLELVAHLEKLAPVPAALIDRPAQRVARDDGDGYCARANREDIREIWTLLGGGSRLVCPGCGGDDQSEVHYSPHNTIHCFRNKCVDKPSHSVIDLVCWKLGLPFSEHARAYDWLVQHRSLPARHGSEVVDLVDEPGMTIDDDDASIPSRDGETSPQPTTTRAAATPPVSIDVHIQRLLRSYTFVKTPIGRIFGHVDHLWLPTDSEGFRARVAKHFNTATKGKLIGKDQIDRAMLPITGSDLPVRDVPVRIAAYQNGVIIDLGDASGRCIEVLPGTVRVLESSPVPLYRPATMRALPVPALPSSIDEARAWLEELRALLAIEGASTWHGVLAWLLQLVRQGSSYAVLIVRGEQGSGKTSRSRLLRRLIDPRIPEATALPKDESNLAIAAENAHVLAFDNLNRVSREMSDALCRLAIGGGNETRTLYSNRDLTSFEAARPMVLNGISDAATEPDLLDRSIILTFERPKKRQADDRVNAEFAKLWPKALGALCYIVAQGLHELAGVTISSEIRMQAPCAYATACEPALGLPKGTMEAVYTSSKDVANDISQENPAVAALVTWMKRISSWSGTAAQLMAAIRDEMTDPITNRVAKGAPEFPRGARALLDRNSTALKSLGITFAVSEEGRASARRTIITLTYQPVGLCGEAGWIGSDQPDPAGAGNVGVGSDGAGGSDLLADIIDWTAPAAQA